MCGRARCTLRQDGISAACGINNGVTSTVQMDRYQPRYNVSPGSYMPVVRRASGSDGQSQGQGQGHVLHCMKWGLIPSFTKKTEKPDHYRMFNARSESICEKASFRRLVPNNRCLVTVEGFYEWKKDGSKKQPYYIHFKNGQPLVFAALYDSWTNSEGEVLYTFTIVTTSSSSSLQWLHDRMPVILGNKSSIDEWLNGSASSKFSTVLKPYEDSDLVWYPVTPAMGKPSFDGPECIIEIPLKTEEKNLISNFFSKKKDSNEQQLDPKAETSTEPVHEAPAVFLGGKESNISTDFEEESKHSENTISSLDSCEEEKSGVKRDHSQLSSDLKPYSGNTEKLPASPVKKKGNLKSAGDKQQTLLSFFGKSRLKRFPLHQFKTSNMTSSSEGTKKQIPEWVSELSSKVKPPEKASPLCYIYKVPSTLRVAGADKFEPRVISIGPYHINMENLVVTEDKKELFVQSLISRITKSPTSTSQGTTAENPILIKMWNDISNLQAGFHEWYSPKPDLNDEDFVKMLIYDGCFILELLYRYALDQMGDTDMLFQNNWMIPCLQLDLVLLENQIPYPVLTYLFELAPKITRPAPDAQPSTTEPYSLKEYVLYFCTFFDPIIPTTDASDIDSSTTDRHLLDLLRNHLIHQDGTQVVADMGKKETWEYTTCATELRNAGVTFKRKKANGLLDITFSDGIFEMPPFHFGKSWAILFPNLIALEQCRKDYPDKITSYAILMDNLINSSNDVKLLRDKGIIDGWNEEDETISQIVNSLCKEAVFETFYYDGVCSRLNAHRRRGLNQWRAGFVRNYIHTPWAGISLAGATFLLFLTLVQTVFSILSWRADLS